MRRIGLAVVLALSVVLAPLTDEAQQASKVYRVGFLHWGSRGPGEQQFQAFEQALRERGWVTGENLVITYRFAEGQYDRLPSLAVELVRLEPHVIVALPTAATRAAKNVTSTIPIVMVMVVSDPIGERLITSFARPGANVTGLALIPTLEIYAKQLQLLKEAVPRAQRIALLRNPANPAAAPIVRTVEDAARALGVELWVSGARAPEEFEPAFRAMTQARADALLVVSDAVYSGAHRARFATGGPKRSGANEPRPGALDPDCPGPGLVLGHPRRPLRVGWDVRGATRGAAGRRPHALREAPLTNTRVLDHLA
jgi:ABC-type uncharacterized transport system substrate-binding protein